MVNGAAAMPSAGLDLVEQVERFADLAVHLG